MFYLTVLDYSSIRVVVVIVVAVVIAAAVAVAAFISSLYNTYKISLKLYH